MMHAKSAKPAKSSNGQSDERGYMLLSKYAITSEYRSTRRSTNAAGAYSILIFTALTSDTMVLLNNVPMAAMLNSSVRAEVRKAGLVKVGP